MMSKFELMLNVLHVVILTVMLVALSYRMRDEQAVMAEIDALANAAQGAEGDFSALVALRDIALKARDRFDWNSVYKSRLDSILAFIDERTQPPRL